MPVTLDLEDKSTAALWCWAISLKRDQLRKQGGPTSDINFLNNVIDLLYQGKTDHLEQLWDHVDCAVDDAVCAELDQAYREVYGEEPPCDEELAEEIFSYEVPRSVAVTKQTRKRDKKKKDDKRMAYARHYCNCGTPRVKDGKSEAEYVLPAKRSKWKKFLKNKSNRTVRRHKGYLPKGNGYRKMDDDLYIWW